MTTTRRDFFRNTALIGATLASAQFLTACADGVGDDLQEGEYTDELAQSCTVPTISANHGHALIVPAADANAGVAKTYAIKGTSAHPHSVTISALQFTTLKAGGTITVKSTVDAGHSHDVTVKCVAAAPPPPPACSNGATAQSITANHGHVLTIPKADAVAGVQKVYSIKGTSAHNHTLTITAANFVALKNRQVITVTSSADAGHLHTVKVICA